MRKLEKISGSAPDHSGWQPTLRNGTKTLPTRLSADQAKSSHELGPSGTCLDHPTAFIREQRRSSRPWCEKTGSQHWDNHCCKENRADGIEARDENHGADPTPIKKSYFPLADAQPTTAPVELSVMPDLSKSIPVIPSG
ncbi:unnamed protein product [Trichogramma brassicae]|uniref:Uncharacterized protein n=1 Tax=Trichogramma brassicae TaxID=86971 RepID=A0A6H5I123_9HYME|nr:unnamed protein product [Trichogramma brassicae]